MNVLRNGLHSIATFARTINPIALFQPQLRAYQRRRHNSLCHEGRTRRVFGHETRSIDTRQSVSARPKAYSPSLFSLILLAGLPLKAFVKVWTQWRVEIASFGHNWFKVFINIEATLLWLVGPTPKPHNNKHRNIRSLSVFGLRCIDFWERESQWRLVLSICNTFPIYRFMTNYRWSCLPLMRTKSDLICG